MLYPVEPLALQLFQLLWGGRRGSNPRQPAPQTRALPTELHPPQILTFITYFFYILMVGVKGLEPSTPWSQTRCATRLRYTPIYFFFKLKCDYNQKIKKSQEFLYLLSKKKHIFYKILKYNNK